MVIGQEPGDPDSGVQVVRKTDPELTREFELMCGEHTCMIAAAVSAIYLSHFRIYKLERQSCSGGHRQAQGERGQVTVIFQGGSAEVQMPVSPTESSHRRIINGRSLSRSGSGHGIAHGHAPGRDADSGERTGDSE